MFFVCLDCLELQGGKLSNYNLSLNIENTLVDALSKQNLKNLSDENAKIFKLFIKK